MALYIGTILLWFAAVSRVLASVRRPDGARISMTVATICIAVALPWQRSAADLMPW
jgi:hypothetical protein